MKHHWQRYVGAALMLAVLAVGTAFPNPALADPPASPPAANGNGNDSDVCTTFAERAQKMDQEQDAQNDQNCPEGQETCSSQGILSEIYLYIKEIVENATQKLFNAFVESDAYQNAVGGTMVLMIAIFGTAFTMGVMQASFGQVLVRLVKIGLIFTLISPGGWEFFNGTMAKFFTDGTDELVKGVTAIGTGVQPPAGATPFYQFDKLAEFVIHPETIAGILGSVFSGGPFGALMGGMMIISTYGFLMLLLRALQQYAISFVARTLLLGLAPVFFIFLLFEKTKNLFMSWLNSIISLALRPILLFTFLAFFMVLIETAAKDMFSAELCWSAGGSVEGSTDRPEFWHFVNPQTHETIDSKLTWNGSYECLLSGKGNCPEFPINIVDLLSFLILVYLATRFVDSIEQISNELGSAFVSLDTSGRLDSFIRRQGSNTTGGGILGSGNQPSTPPRATPPR